MQINWKARFKNKAFLVIFATTIVAFVYQMLGLFGIVPKVSEELIIELIGIIINLLVALGIVIDPTTEGISDSDRAMTYFTEYDEREIDESDGAAAEREEMQRNE